MKIGFLETLLIVAALTKLTGLGLTTLPWLSLLGIYALLVVLLVSTLFALLVFVSWLDTK